MPCEFVEEFGLTRLFHVQRQSCSRSEHSLLALRRNAEESNLEPSLFPEDIGDFREVTDALKPKTLVESLGGFVVIKIHADQVFHP